jgi:hypothetical protein
MWCSLSDESTGLPFTIAAGSHQGSHSWDSDSDSTRQQMELQGKIKKNLVLTDPGHIVYISVFYLFISFYSHYLSSKSTRIIK